MEFLQKRRKLWAVVFQSAFLFFILFSVLGQSGNAVLLTSDSKALLCVGAGSSVLVREASEQLSTSLPFIYQHSIEKIWLCSARIHALELFTNTALHISGREYNPFYVLTTIHAP